MATIESYSGYVHANNGQFGRSRVAALTANISGATGLWTAYPERPYRLLLDPNGAARTVDFPVIAASTSLSTAEAMINSSFFVSNESSVTGETLTLRDSTGAAMTDGVLQPGELAQVTATAAANTWRVTKYFRAHAATHLAASASGTDPIDFERGGITTFTTPINYAPTTLTTGSQNTSATASDQLGAHLIGIDNALTALGNTITWKAPSRVVTAAALPPFTQAGSGVGATLTANANASINAVGIDGVTTLALNDRVLVTQTGTGGSSSDTGIYTITALGDGSNPWVFTRATDLDTDQEYVAGVATVIEEGATCADTIFIVSTNNLIIIDTTAVDWVKFNNVNASALLSTGTGLTISTTQYNPNGANASISLTAALNNLTDVTVAAPADNQILVYDNGSSQWVNETPSTLTSGLSGGMVFSATYSPTTGDRTISSSLDNMYSGATTTSAAPKNQINLLASPGALTVRDAAVSLGGTLLTVQNNAGTRDYLDVSTTSFAAGGGAVASGSQGVTIGFNAVTAGLTNSAANTMLLAGSDPGNAVTISTANTGDDRLVKLFSDGELLIADADTSGPDYRVGNKFTTPINAAFTTTGAAASAAIGSVSIPNNTAAGFVVTLVGVCRVAGGGAVVGDTWYYRGGFTAYNNATSVSISAVTFQQAIQPAGLNLGFSAVSITGGVGDNITVNLATNGSTGNLTGAVIRWTCIVEGTLSSTAA